MTENSNRIHAIFQPNFRTRSIIMIFVQTKKQKKKKMHFDCAFPLLSSFSTFKTVQRVNQLYCMAIVLTILRNSNKKNNNNNKNSRSYECIIVYQFFFISSSSSVLCASNTFQFDSTNPLRSSNQTHLSKQVNKI